MPPNATLGVDLSATRAPPDAAALLPLGLLLCPLALLFSAGRAMVHARRREADEDPLESAGLRLLSEGVCLLCVMFFALSLPATLEFERVEATLAYEAAAGLALFAWGWSWVARARALSE